MNVPHSDALVFFGATGDLAYKKIFPSLQTMIKRGHLDVPVIGVAKAGWNIDQLRARARESLDKHGAGADPAVLAKKEPFDRLKRKMIRIEVTLETLKDNASQYRPRLEILNQWQKKSS